ncbi:hypothetical protein CDD83_4354 [Cordyceps sp. RAO-2017]|nr:hypothetical protein CDD83_4354 [Cordyceps sp. RAO-2017]
MAAVTRQPFAPLDGVRLQNLTSLKNRQNALTPSGTSGKRKAELLEADDLENVDPLLFAKRSKGLAAVADSPAKDALKKPSSVLLFTKPSPASLSTPRHHVRAALSSPSKPASTSRRLLQPKSPLGKLDAGAVSKSSPLSAPAGRSPTRAKRSGILSSRRRSAGSYARVDPPSFTLAASAPFSLDAALKGTISSYGARPAAPVEAPASAGAANPSLAAAGLGEPEMKASWFFDIHEDTPEQEMTNLLQHGTCVLDISSDEETELKDRQYRAEGRDKENIPPADDISQTSARRAARPDADDMLVDKERVALGEMNTADFYPDGCDASSVVVIPADDDEEPLEPAAGPSVPAPRPLESAPETDALSEADCVELLMQARPDGSSSKAAVLQPIDGTDQSFELWESGSAKDESEMAAASAPVATS